MPILSCLKKTGPFESIFIAIATTSIGIDRNKIAKNEQNKINSGITEIFGNNASVTETNSIDSNVYKYVTLRYVVSDNLGWAFRTDGFNSYGKISLIVGFDTNFAYEGLSVITNEQSFATTLNKNYIKVIQDGSKTVDDVSVSCGATYGAKLVRDMINEATILKSALFLINK